eukprot:355169-Chlamydomonas_euryale.AAC.5
MVATAELLVSCMLQAAATGVDVLVARPGGGGRWQEGAAAGKPAGDAAEVGWMEKTAVALLAIGSGGCVLRRNGAHPHDGEALLQTPHCVGVVAAPTLCATPVGDGSGS